MTIIDETVPDQQKEDAFEVDERMKALSSIYELTDSIIAGEKISVSVGARHNTQAPAWTTGADIFINTATIGLSDFDDVVRLHGLNFHELAHVLYTPRSGTVLAQWCIDRNLQPALNVLEDQRIESMLTTRYPSTAPWLSAAVMRWVTADASALDKGYIFVRGRRYLPGQLRGLLRRHFQRKDLLPRIDAVIDAYRLLAFPSDYDKAKPLVREMQCILDELGRSMPPDPNGHSECPWHLPEKGRPVSVKEQRKLRDRMGSEPENKGESGSDGSPKDGQDPSASQPGDGESQDTTDEYVKDSSDGVSEHSIASSDERADALEAVEDMLDALMESEEVRTDVRRTLKTLASAGGSDVLPRSKFFNHRPLEDFVLLERQLTRTLARLSEEAEPGWHRRQDMGRLNVVRWAIERDPEEAFDRWDEGVIDAIDIEAVLMLDSSGSMGAVIEQAFNAMWVTKRAFDAVDISTTVITFDGSSEIVYSRDERAEADLIRYAYKGGGTNPAGGLNQALRILSSSRKAHKLLVVLTDGYWSESLDEFGITSDEYIQRMNDLGATTAVGFISPGLEELMEQGIDVQAEIAQHRHNGRITGLANYKNLVPFVGDIVTGLIRQRLRAAR